MNLHSLLEKKGKLTAEVTDLELRLRNLTADTESVRTQLDKARGGLAVITEFIEAEQTASLPKRETETLLLTPAIKLRDAVRKATFALKKFTRDDLEQWIRSNYPQLQFNKKSVDRPMRELMATREMVVLRQNTGNKVPMVYGVTESAETEQSANDVTKI